MKANNPTPTPQCEPPAVYTAAETASILRIQLRKLRQMVDEGVVHPLPYVTGKMLFARREVSRIAGDDA